MSEQPEKRRIPRLSKKRRSLGELGGDSLAAALYWNELTDTPPTNEPAPQQQPAERPSEENTDANATLRD